MGNIIVVSLEPDQGNVLLDLVLVQTVSKAYQHITKFITHRICKRLAKALIRLCICTGLSEVMQVTQAMQRP